MQKSCPPEIQITTPHLDAKGYTQIRENGLMQWCAYAVLKQGKLDAFLYRESNWPDLGNRIVSVERYADGVSTYVAREALLVGKQGAFFEYVGESVFHKDMKMPFSFLLMDDQLHENKETASLIPIMVKRHLRKAGFG